MYSLNSYHIFKWPFSWNDERFLKKILRRFKLNRFGNMSATSIQPTAFLPQWSAGREVRLPAENRLVWTQSNGSKIRPLWQCNTSIGCASMYGSHQKKRTIVWTIAKHAPTVIHLERWEILTNGCKDGYIDWLPDPFHEGIDWPKNKIRYIESSKRT